MTSHAIPARPTNAELDAELAELEAARERQLDALPRTSLDAVAAAHRGTVERILGELRVARRRLKAGLYGVCAGCGATISPDRLEARPWAVTCAPCGAHPRS